MFSKRECFFGLVAFFVIVLSSCATHQERRSSASSPIYPYVGMSRVELEQSLGKADGETETSSTVWLFYKKLRVTFGVPKNSGMVSDALYPTVNADGRVDESRIDLGYGLDQGISKDQLEHRLGRPSRAAPLAWTYCKFKYIGAHHTPTFLTLEFKYVHPNGAALSNIRMDGRCIAGAEHP